MDTGPSVAHPRTADENARLNEQEYRDRAISLVSYPRALFVQLDSLCNQDCLFCSRPDAYAHFSLDEYMNTLAEPLEPALRLAQRINMTGSGELLQLAEAQRILAYFNGFSQAEKMFATNGSSLTPKMADFIAESGSRYTIHVSLHASTIALHETMTKARLFPVIHHNLIHVDGLKKRGARITMNLIFVATTANIADLPAFVRYAAGVGADRVIVYYNYVYRRDQKVLSCHGAQEETNRQLEAAAREAGHVGIAIDLPPRFGQPSYGVESCCGEAWSQFMVNPRGDVITCDVAGDSRETLIGKTFREVWNGPYYMSIRTRLAAGDFACSRFCWRANPGSVNDIRSHVITRGKSPEEIAWFTGEPCA